jgi:hypothetical protein
MKIIIMTDTGKNSETFLVTLQQSNAIKMLLKSI